MNETKPTANAATTVVSAWAAAIMAADGETRTAAGGRSRAVAGEVLVEALGLGGAERGRRGRGIGLVVVVARAPPPPARQQDRQSGEQREDDRDRDEVGGELEAVVLGRREDGRAVA